MLQSSFKSASSANPRPLSSLLKLAHVLHYTGLSLASLWMLGYMVRHHHARTSHSLIHLASELLLPDNYHLLARYAQHFALGQPLCAQLRIFLAAVRKAARHAPGILPSVVRAHSYAAANLVTLVSARFVYYLSKFWELLDSIFQVQKARSLGPKGSPPPFLHYYHHAAVMVSPALISHLHHESTTPVSGHVLELDRIQPDAAVAWPRIQHFRPRHHVRDAAQTFVLAALCPPVATLTFARRISPLTSRYAYYAFTVYSPAPRPLKMLITQVRRHIPQALSREFVFAVYCLSSDTNSSIWLLARHFYGNFVR